MDNFFDRLLKERAELHDRIASLDFFIKISPKYKELKCAQKGALVRQLEVMKEYLKILDFRIDDEIGVKDHD